MTINNPNNEHKYKNERKRAKLLTQKLPTLTLGEHQLQYFSFHVEKQKFFYKTNHTIDAAFNIKVFINFT